jgi:hypothetical protein
LCRAIDLWNVSWSPSGKSLIVTLVWCWSEMSLERVTREKGTWQLWRSIVICESWLNHILPRRESPDQIRLDHRVTERQSWFASWARDSHADGGW